MQMNSISSNTGPKRNVEFTARNDIQTKLFEPYRYDGSDDVGA